MENEPSVKQIKFAESLGINNPSQYSRGTLKELISNKLEEGGEKKPAKVTFGKPAQEKKGIHLTPESVKIAALNAAIETMKSGQGAEFWARVGDYEAYINGNRE